VVPKTCNQFIQIFLTADDNRSPMFRVVSPDGGGIGSLPSMVIVLRDTMALDRLAEEARAAGSSRGSALHVMLKLSSDYSRR